MKRWTVLLLTVMLCLLPACGKKEQVTLRCDLTAAPDTLDPQFAASDAARLIIANTFEGLVRRSETGEPLPGCAERWEESDDSLTWTFFLRDGLKWSDGSELTARDFVFALRRLFDPSTGATAAQSFLSVKNAAEILSESLPASALGVSAPDDKTVVIALTRADPSLLSQLAQAAAMPCSETFFTDQKGRYGLSADHLLCNGPYYAASWNQSSIGLRPNASYRESAKNAGVNLYLSRGDAVALFLAGESDVCIVPFHRLDEVGTLSGERFLSESWVLLLNTKSGVCADSQIRAAFVGSVDRGELLERLGENVSASRGLVPPGAAIGGGIYRELAGRVADAPVLPDARAALTEALNRLGMSALPRVTLLVSDFIPGPTLGGTMQRQWQQTLSAFVNMEQLPYNELLARVESGDFDLAVVSLTAQGNTAVDYLSRFAEQSLSDENTLGTLLDSARQQSDRNAAAADLLAAEQELVDQSVALPLFEAPSLFLQQKGISGASYFVASQTIYFADAQSVR